MRGRGEAGRLVRREHLHGDGRGRRQEPARRFANWRARNPGTRIVVMGCYATRAPEEVAALPGVVEVVTDKRELPDLLGRFGVVDIPTGISRFRRPPAGLRQGAGRLPAELQLLHHSQGAASLASRPAEHILDEVRRLVDNGYREIVLTGIHLGHYGIEFNRGRPKCGVAAVVASARPHRTTRGDFRIRLSSIEATEVTRELVAVMAEHARQSLPASARFDAERFRRAYCGGCGAAGAPSGSSTVAGWSARRWTSRP